MDRDQNRTQTTELVTHEANAAAQPDPAAAEPTAADSTAAKSTATDPTATEPTATDQTAPDQTATGQTATGQTATKSTAVDQTAPDSAKTDLTAARPSAAGMTAASPSEATPTGADSAGTSPAQTDSPEPGSAEPEPTRTDDTVNPSPPDPGTVERLLGGAHHDPHSVLGAHPHPDGTVIRSLRPHADEVRVVLADGVDVPLVRVHDAGLFSGVVPGPPTDYRLAVRYGERVDQVDDPYRWLPTLGEMDLHLIAEGRHERLWDVLGAHIRSYDTPSGTISGTSFAVWAPSAQGVRVTGDFDGWAGWTHPTVSYTHLTLPTKA